MAAVTVGTSAVRLSASGRQRPVIQNLGAGNIYIGEDSGVTTSNGLKIPPNTAFEYASPISSDGAVWVVSDTAGTDVRYLTLGG